MATLLNTADQPAGGVPDSNATTAPAKSKRRRTWGRFFFDISLYLCLYIVISAVSIGPFFWHWFGAVYCDGPKWIARFYMPLGIACEFCPPLDWAVNAWIRWWIL